MGLLDILSDRKREPAECVIKVGSSQAEITDLYPFLSEVVVETSRTDPAVATLTFETRRDEQGKWVVQDSGLFAPWEPILIETAFGSYREEVMRGYVLEIKADYPEDAGSTQVSVSCQDDSLALDREHVRREWGGDAPVTDDTIVREVVVQRNGLALHADSAAGSTGLVLNQDGTDIQFLRKRAEANGYELLFREGEVYFGPMRFDLEPQDTIMVYAGSTTHCHKFAVQDQAHKPDKVAFDLAATEGAANVETVVEPDLPLLGTEPADSGSSGLVGFVWRMSRQSGRNEQEVTALAQKKANDESLKVRADGEMDGSRYGHVLRVGEPVGVDGVGDRYGGIYYVDSVKHLFDVEGYRETFVLVRNAYGDNLESSSSPLAGVI